AQARDRAGNPAEAGAPREAGENTGTMRIPKATLAQMLAADQIARAGQRGRRDAGANEYLGDRSGSLQARPGGGGIVDRLSRLDALRQPMLSQRRQSRDEGAQPSPFLVIGDRETDPPVLAGAPVGAVRSIALGPGADRLRQ